MITLNFCQKRLVERVKKPHAKLMGSSLCNSEQKSVKQFKDLNDHNKNLSEVSK